MKRSHIIIIAAVIVGIIIIVFAATRKNSNDAQNNGAGGSSMFQRGGSSSGAGSSLWGKIFSTVESTGEGTVPGQPLTDAQRAENEREFALMRKALPGNYWLPGKQTEEEAEQQRAFIADLVVLQNKMRSNTATPEEKRRFYDMNIKMDSDKIDMLKYFQDRAHQLEQSENRHIFTQSDIERGLEEMEDLQKKVSENQKKRAAVK